MGSRISQLKKNKSQEEVVKSAVATPNKTAPTELAPSQHEEQVDDKQSSPAPTTEHLQQQPEPELVQQAEPVAQPQEQQPIEDSEPVGQPEPIKEPEKQPTAEPEPVVEAEESVQAGAPVQDQEAQAAEHQQEELVENIVERTAELELVDQAEPVEQPKQSVESEPLQEPDSLAEPEPFVNQSEQITVHETEQSFVVVQQSDTEQHDEQQPAELEPSQAHQAEPDVQSVKECEHVQGPEQQEPAAKPEESAQVTESSQEHEAETAEQRQREFVEPPAESSVAQSEQPQAVDQQQSELVSRPQTNGDVSKPDDEQRPQSDDKKMFDEQLIQFDEQTTTPLANAVAMQ